MFVGSGRNRADTFHADHGTHVPARSQRKVGADSLVLLASDHTIAIYERHVAP